jgi:hypothetical protein
MQTFASLVSYRYFLDTVDFYYYSNTSNYVSPMCINFLADQTSDISLILCYIRIRKVRYRLIKITRQTVNSDLVFNNF